MNAQNVFHTEDRYFEARPTKTGCRAGSGRAVGQQGYGLPIERVQEVLNGVPVEPVPGTSTVVVGVINLRGSVVTVLDLRTCLDPSQSCPGRGDPVAKYCIVVLDLGGELFGLCVDSVAEVSPPPPQSPAPACR